MTSHQQFRNLETQPSTFDQITTQLKEPMDRLFADPEIGSQISGVLVLGFHHQDKVEDRIPAKTHLELALVFKPGLSNSESWELLRKAGDFLAAAMNPILADMLYDNHIFAGFTSIDGLADSQFVITKKGQKFGIFAQDGDFQTIQSILADSIQRTLAS